MIRRALFIVAAVLSTSWADQVSISHFKLLNNNSNAAVIDNEQAQDLLNVDLSPDGSSVKKRQGYGLYKALSTGQGVHGGIHFFNSGGNDVQVWGSSTSLYGIVADAAPTQLISSATLNATWDCADTQGYAYCVNSSRNALIKTDGATQTWYTTPLGTMDEVTPDRLIVAGVSGSPNTLYISQSNTFTNFTAGNAATDAFTEVIASPGSKLTHIRSACGKLLWWKDQSFGTFDFDDQFTAQVKIVSDSIGTNDNTSSVDPGGNVWFRGQDGHIWKYDCSSLSKETIDITPNVQASSKRTTNFRTQTSQSDFQTGSTSPLGSISFTISPGDVRLSSGSTDGGSNGFASGSFNSTFVYNGAVVLSTNNINVDNYSFETGNKSNWGGGQGIVYSASALRATQAAPDCTFGNPGPGSYFLTYYSLGGYRPAFAVYAKECSDNAVLASVSFNHTANSCTNTLRTLSMSGLARKCVYIDIRDTTNSQSIATSDSFYANGSDITFYTATSDDYGPAYYVTFDLFSNGKSSISSGTYTSRAMDISTGTAISSASWTTSNISNQNSSYAFNPTIEFQTSGNGVTWSKVASSTATVFANNRYVRYVSSFVPTAYSTNADARLNGVQVVTSSGIYFSSVINAPSLTAWGTLNITDSGEGSIAYFSRASTSTFDITSSTPAWVSQTKNANVAASTGTYFQLRSDYAVSLASQTPTLGDFTFNWYEGNATDQAYSIYFDNAIWWAVAYGAGQSTNNYVFKYDLINQGWTLYNIGAGGLLIQGNSLYFGQVGSGNIFKFGNNVKSDNGTAIQSYWKSKDFTGSDPFLEVSLTNIDTFAKRDANQTLTASYALNSSTTTTSYSINLSSTTDAVIRNKKLLPSGKLGGTFNIQYGDTSDSSAWELFGFRIGFKPETYRPTQ